MLRRVARRQPDVSEEHTASYVQGRRVWQARNQQEHTGSSADFLHDLLSGPELESDAFVQNVAFASNYMVLYSTRLFYNSYITCVPSTAC
jgi:hypothetical protein